MAEQNPGAVWDQIIASAQTQLKSQPSPPGRSFAGLSLKPTANPNRAVARIARTPALIDALLRQYIRKLVQGDAPWPLVIQGPAGTGKTCAALCLLDYAGGEYYTVAGLCATVIQAQQGRLEWSHEGRGGTIYPEQFWAKLAQAPLVVLDELGTRGQVSDAHYETVKTCVDERHRRPFVVISNLSLAEVSGLYDDRIFSRLAAGTVVELKGKDRRIA